MQIPEFHGPVASWLMLVHILTTALTTILVAFLTHRRLRKDRSDDLRWLKQELRNESIERKVENGNAELDHDC